MLPTGCEKTNQAHSGKPDFRNELDVVADDIMPWVDLAPMLVSPDGRQLLVKRDLGSGDSELLLKELGTGKHLGRYSGGFPLLIAWRPHSGQLSFVRDNQGDRKYQLLLWTPGTNAVVRPEVPIIRNAKRLMKWSPDGQFLAFCKENETRSEELHIFDASVQSPQVSRLCEVQGMLDYNWSPDGNQIAVVAGGSDAITVIDKKTGARREIAGGTGARFSQVVWDPSGRRLIVVSKESDSQTSVLKSVDLKSGESRIVTPAGLDARQPFVLTDGRIIYQAASDHTRTIKLMLGEPDTATAAILGFDEALTALGAVDELRQEAIIKHEGFTKPAQIYRVSLKDGGKQFVFQSSSLVDIQGVAPLSVALPLQGDTPLRFNVWRAKARPSRGVVIKFPNPMYRNPSFTSTAFDGCCQYIVREGYDYISLDFPESTEREAAALTQQDITRALAVIDYAHNALGAPSDKIVLFGDSAGTAYVAQTAAQMPEQQGGLLLRGIVANIAKTTGKFTKHRFKIAALHGENDDFTPDQARALIEKVFGRDSLTGPDNVWRVLENEGHSVRQTRSRALIGAAILKLLAESDE